jgi:hypothetical protein
MRVGRVFPVRTAAVVLAATALLVLAGCGDNNSSSSSSSGNSSTTDTTSGPTRTITPRQARRARRTRIKTVKKVNKVCRRINVNLAADTADLSAEDSPAQIQAKARKLAARYAAAAKALDQIGAVASQSRKDVGTGVKRASQTLDDARKALELTVAAAQSQDLSQARIQIKRLKSDNLRYQATVRQYKFTDCY